LGINHLEGKRPRGRLGLAARWMRGDGIPPGRATRG